MCNIAMLSVHGCPLGRLGTNEAGGMQLYVRALSRELGRRGMTVDVFTRRSDPSLPRIVAFGENARVIHVDAGEPAPVEKTRLYDLLPEFEAGVLRFRRCADVDYHFVHSHYWLSGLVGAALARDWEVPHLTMFHTLGRLKNQALYEGGEPPERLDAETRVIATADRVIAASEHERLALEELYGLRRDRIAVIPCGVDLDLFRPGDRDAARATLGLAGDVLLFVGRMDPIKGLDRLLQVMALLQQRRALTLVVAGGSGSEEELRHTRDLAASLNLDGRVQFRGAIRQDLLPLYYRAATVSVVPSYYESFGLVAMEALACGTPVVASQVGGLPTVVHDGENGLLVPSRRPEAFAERIERLLDDDALRQRLAARARASVTRFGWGAVAERVIAQYRVLAAARRPALACLEGI